MKRLRGRLHLIDITDIVVDQQGFSVIRNREPKYCVCACVRVCNCVCARACVCFCV